MASATVASSPTAAISRSQSSSTLINASSGPLRLGTEFHLKTGLTHYARSEALVKGICEKIFRWRTTRMGSPHPTTVITLLRPKDLPVFHHKLHTLEHLNVAQRVATHRDDVGERAGSYHADLALHIEHHGRAGSSALDRIHRLHAEFHHARKFLRDRLGPRDSAHVGAEHDLHSRLQRLFERHLVCRGAQAVALPSRRIRWCPVGVVHAERGHI